MAEKSNGPQLPPRLVRRDRKKENRGGYDCDFVEKPPEAFQTDCPVCLLILKEPCLISCCGHKFCRECIEQVKKDDKPCPLCGEQDFTFMRERGLERFLKGSEVWCSYKKEGCEWKGKLGKLQEHLNQDPCTSPGIQLSRCEFVAVECIYKCGEWFQRRHIATHQNEQCKKRPYTCEFCQDYASTFEDATEIHYPECDKYPVTCPNDCGTHKMERQDLEGHLRDKCPLALVDCPFHYAGCETQLPRKDMPEHMKETVTHLTLLATVTQRLVKENQELKERVLEREDESRRSMEAVQASLQKLMEENQELKQSTVASLQELNTKYDSVVAENQQSLTETDKAKEAIEKVNKKSAEEIQHLRLQLEATIQAQDQIDKERKRMYQENHQQFLHTLQRIEQSVNKQARLDIVDSLLKEGEVWKDIGLRQVSISRYILHHNIEHTCTLQRIDQSQNFCVSTSDITPTRESELRSMYIPVFPLDFHIKQTDERWYSSPFYTHPRGYKMHISVDPKGVGDGEGTHVSIFTYMLCGPFDDYLKWPFRGEITIQLVNQAGDHDHIEKIISYTDTTPDDCAGRVTGRERAEGWGKHQFLAHSHLDYNAARKTQYLKDNHLIVRVVKVVLT